MVAAMVQTPSSFQPWAKYVRHLALALLISLTSCQVVDSNNTDQGDDAKKLERDTLFCGQSFSIAIPLTDRFEIEPDTPEDFILYRWRKSGKIVTIYEGNNPMKGGAVRKTARHPWPEYVVVHGSETDAKLIHIFKTKPKGCTTPKFVGETE